MYAYAYVHGFLSSPNSPKGRFLARALQASDIHCEPYEKKLRVRYRIDGVLHEEMTPPLRLKAAMVSRGLERCIMWISGV